MHLYSIPWNAKDKIIEFATDYVHSHFHKLNWICQVRVLLLLIQFHYSDSLTHENRFPNVRLSFHSSLAEYHDSTLVNKTQLCTLDCTIIKLWALFHIYTHYRYHFIAGIKILNNLNLFIRISFGYYHNILHMSIQLHRRQRLCPSSQRHQCSGEQQEKQLRTLIEPFGFNLGATKTIAQTLKCSTSHWMADWYWVSEIKRSASTHKPQAAAGVGGKGVPQIT